MAKHHPHIPFARFADDILCHCDREQQARNLKEALEKRFAECGLELHPQKTRIVYCKDDDRRGRYPHEKFDFLGYSFRARRSKNRWGKCFVNFSPGVSNAATKAIREEIRDWQLRCRVDKWIDDLTWMFNPTVRVGSTTTVVITSRPFIPRCAILTGALPEGCDRIGRRMRLAEIQWASSANTTKRTAVRTWLQVSRPNTGCSALAPSTARIHPCMSAVTHAATSGDWCTGALGGALSMQLAWPVRTSMASLPATDAARAPVAAMQAAVLVPGSTRGLSPDRRQLNCRWPGRLTPDNGGWDMRSLLWRRPQ
jgi:hypothetical protein